MKKRTIFNALLVAMSLLMEPVGYSMPTLAQGAPLEVTIVLISGGEPVEIVANGQSISLSAKSNPPSGNFTFAWKLSSRIGKLLSRSGQVATYQAPPSVTTLTKVTVTVTMTDKQTKKQVADSITIELKPPPNDPPPTSGINPVIQSPKDGALLVDAVIRVNGSKATLGKKLYVVVQPEGHGHFAQPPATVNRNLTWVAQEVHVGQAGDEGLSFRVCAVVTAAELPVGQELPSMPEGSSSCITIKRITVPPPPSCSQPPLITSQKNGDQVQMVISVQGTGAPAGCNLYILIQPQNFNYFVQSSPTVNADGKWSVARAQVGEGQDAGKSFTICAVLISQVLSLGQQLGAPPEPKFCVQVTRA